MGLLFLVCRGGSPFDQSFFTQTRHTLAFWAEILAAGVEWVDYEGQGPRSAAAARASRAEIKRPRAKGVRASSGAAPAPATGTTASTRPG